MNRNLWAFFIGILFLFSSCQSEDDFLNPNLTQTKELEVSHFYGVKLPAEETLTRGVAQRNKLWAPGTTITVKFLNDPYNMAEKIKTYATEWEKYANIKFDFVSFSEDADVRIGFDWKDSKWVTWSYTGNDCKYIKDQNEATVNFSFWDSTSEIVKKADVLRAFGQVLGLELEHRHLSFDAGWTSRIADYWKGEIEDIPWNELNEYVLAPINTRNLIQTKEYDENSIMIWPFSRKYATNTARDYNYKLSDQDIEFIQQLYPGKKENKEETVAFTFKLRIVHSDGEKSGSVELYLGLKTAFTFIDIDFGDGSKETIVGTTNLIHKFSNNQEYIVKVYGDPASIYEIGLNLYSNFAHIEYVDVSQCTELINFSAQLDPDRLSNELVNIDFSKNTKLFSLRIDRGSNLSTLDLSKNKELTQLSLVNCEKLSNLNLSECTSLNTINISYITTVDENKNTLFLENESSAIDFANKLPISSNGWSGIYIHQRKNDNFTLSWVEDICKSKGWEIRYDDI